jgi:basic membrane lipoprotein Med (substrate-binding protein (PBP1-ABC) superfamily)
MEMALGWRAARKVLEDTQPKDVGQVRLRMQEALSRGEAERRHLPSDTSMNWIDAPTIQVLADIMPEVAKIVSEAVQEVRAQVTEEGDRHYG